MYYSLFNHPRCFQGLVIRLGITHILVRVVSFYFHGFWYCSRLYLIDGSCLIQKKGCQYFCFCVISFGWCMLFETFWLFLSLWSTEVLIYLQGFQGIRFSNYYYYWRICCFRFDLERRIFFVRGFIFLRLGVVIVYGKRNFCFFRYLLCWAQFGLGLFFWVGLLLGGSLGFGLNCCLDIGILFC